MAVAYLNAFETIYRPLLLGLIILSQMLYLTVLYFAPGILKSLFNPGFSALTFRLIVTAIALKGAVNYFEGLYFFVCHRVSTSNFNCDKSGCRIY